MTGLRRASLLTANFSLHLFHQVWIAFCEAGWMFCETRLISIITLMLTLFSWYVLGPLFTKCDAYGYCVITDIQWQIREKLDLEKLPGGYIKYLADSVFRRDFDAHVVDKWGAAFFFICIVASVTTLFLYGSCLKWLG